MKLKKWSILQRIVTQRVVAVLRADSAEQLEQFSERCIEGGLQVLELTFTTPGVLSVVERLTKRYGSNRDIVIGAGTVLDAETARLAILAGAEFVVTPYFQPDVVKVCHRYQVPVMPGASTVKEVVEGLESGADIMKVFPGDVVGSQFISSIKGPLPQANLMPTGGVHLDNLEQWFAAGAICVGIGSDLTKEAAKSGDLDMVTQKARAYREAVAKLPY